MEWALRLAADEGKDDHPHYAVLMEMLQDAQATDRAYRDDKRCLIDFMKAKAIMIPTDEFDAWRMLPVREQTAGEVIGLPLSRGILRATNGVLCYIERADGSVIMNHIQHWKADVSFSTTHMLIGAKAARAERQRVLDAMFS